MTIEQTQTVDFVSVDAMSGAVVLTIADHLGWDDQSRHLQLLQDKLNAYVAFIEGGELTATVPDAAGRQVIIRIRSKYPPSAHGELLISRCTSALLAADIRLENSIA